MTSRIRSAALILAALTAPATSSLARQSWDSDGDGILRVEEFLDGFANMATFAIFDTDRSGSLDAAEWEADLTDIGEYANMDLNGDGGVDGAEYNALLFNHYDSDGSGALDAAEIERIGADLQPGGMLAR